MKSIRLGWFLVCFLQFIQCEPFLSVPLIPKKSAFEILLEQNTHPKHLAKLFDPKKYSKYERTPKPHSNDTVQLFKFLQSQFYGEVLVGSPGQKFRMVFDTAFAHLWVPSVLCSPFAYPACATRNKYDSTKSTTYIPDGRNYTIYTDRGEISGFISKEKFHLGHINVMNQSFAEMDKISLLQLMNVGSDGVIGLGYVTNSKDVIPPIFQNIIMQKLLPNPVFSFYINRAENTNKGGTLYLGSSESKHFNGSLTYLPVKSDNFLWKLDMDKVIVEYKLPFRNEYFQVCTSGCKVFPDTADVLISGPKNDIIAINNIISANYVRYLDRYEVSCNKIHVLPKIHFVLGGKNYTLKGKDYVQQVKYGPVTICLSAFTELKIPPEEKPLWSLGISFLGQYYVEFNFGKNAVGLAPVVSGP